MERLKMKPDFIICGIEHSGTTLISDIFRQTADHDSGFEVGVLLADTPREFRYKEPFVGNLVSGWGVPKEKLDHLCDCDDFEEFYARLWSESKVINKSKKKFFDKTPRYLHQLEMVAERIQRPIISCYKDPRSIVASDFKRSGNVDFDEWYDSYMPKKKSYMSQLYAQYLKVKKGDIPDCIAVSLEDVCLDTRRTLERVFDLTSNKFQLDYLNLSNLRYVNTKAPYIAGNIPFDYLRQLSVAARNQIETDFSGLSDWFYR